jgi:hypothetical protein
MPTSQIKKVIVVVDQDDDEEVIGVFTSIDEAEAEIGVDFGQPTGLDQHKYWFSKMPDDCLMAVEYELNHEYRD